MTRMTVPIDREHGWRGALAFAGALEDLAPYVLTDDALQAARAWAEHVGCGEEYKFCLSRTAETRAGACVALFVWNGAPGGELHRAWLAPSFGLPLCWDGVQPDPYIPPGLRRLEKHIVKLFAPAAGRNESDQPVHLRLAVKPSAWKYFLEESGVKVEDLECESAFAPLAAAFILRHFGGKLNAEVYATGTRGEPDSAAICPVRDIPNKIALVERLGGKELFVPYGAESSTVGGVAVSQLEKGHYSPVRAESERVREALTPLLGRLAVQPPPEASLDDHIQFLEAMTDWSSDMERSRYYRTSILPIEVRDIHNRFVEDHHKPVDSLVAVVEIQKPEVCDILIRAMDIDPAKCLLFVSGEGQLQGALAEAQVVRMKGCPKFEELAELFRRSVYEWLADKNNDWAERTAFDVTSGTKLMSLAMVRTAEEFHARICCLESPNYLKRCRLPVGDKSIVLLPTLGTPCRRALSGSGGPGIDIDPQMHTGDGNDFRFDI